MNREMHTGTTSLTKQALLTIRQLRAALEKRTSEPIAIIGIACRVPGANSLKDFWTLLAEQRDAITEVPATRWKIEDFYDHDPLALGKMNTRWAGIIEADRFDAAFFGISDEEACYMDPQQRVFLEVAWEAIESAGLSRDDLQGSNTGIFVGVVNYNSGYVENVLGSPRHINAFSGPGISNSVLAGRLSYLFDLRGPNLAIDTACSSSLVAVHQACQSLRQQECDAAIAGGVNLILKPAFTIATTRMQLMAADGRCKPFDNRADGIVRSDGCGAIFLKRLSDALRDGDRIQTVIYGSAVNQDGKTNGMTAPNGHAQEALIRKALNQAQLDPGLIDYIEAHGTGTKLGDPIEVAAIINVMRSQRRHKPCYIGSVKANVGHCEAAAGIISLIKAALCLQHQAIPGQPHLSTLNSHIDLQEKCIDFPRTLLSWSNTDQPLHYIGVSAFGWSGTNAHLIVGATPTADSIETVSPTPMIAPVADRENVESSNSELAVPSKLAIIFSGQGSQWPGMVDELLTHAPCFRNTLLKCQEIIQQLAGWSLIDAIKQGSESELNRTSLAQPCIVAIQISLFALISGWGFSPAAVMGHSVGEFSAAYCAGILTLEQTLKAVINRGRIMEAIRNHGRMYAVFASADQVAALISDCLGASISAFNSPLSTVISVQTHAEKKIHQLFRDSDLELIPCNMHYPFHCGCLEPLREALAVGFAHLEHRKAEILWISSVQGKELSHDVMNTHYWVNNARLPVRFQEAISSLLRQGCTDFVEVGPHSVLIQHIKACLEYEGRKGRVMGMLYRGVSNRQSTANLIADLHEPEKKIDPASSSGSVDSVIQSAPRVWQHRSYWVSACQPDLLACSKPSLLGKIDPLPLDKISFSADWGTTEAPLLSDHCLFDQVVVPGAVHLAVLLTHGLSILKAPGILLSDISFIQPLILKCADSITVNIELVRQSLQKQDYAYRINTCHNNKSTQSDTDKIPQGSILLSMGELAPARHCDIATLNVEILQQQLQSAISLEVGEFYQKAHTAGLQLGPAFKCIESLSVLEAKGQLIFKLRSPPDAESSDLLVAPGLLDACFQALIAAHWFRHPEADLFIPLAIERILVPRKFSAPIWGIASLEKVLGGATEILESDLRLFEADGRGLASFDKVKLKRAPRDALLRRVEMHAIHLFNLHWVKYEQVVSNSPLFSRLRERGIKKCMIVGDNTHFIESVQRLLQDNGIEVVIINGFDIDVASNLDATFATYETSDPLIYVANHKMRLTVSEITRDELRAFECLRLIANKMATYSHQGSGKLWIVTHGVQRFGEQFGKGGLSGSSVCGLVRVIEKEYPTIATHLIDVPSEEIDQEKTVALLLSMIADPAARGTFLIHDQYIWECRLQSLTIEQRKCEVESSANYLITGGFGESGQMLADELFSSGARHVTLMGRSVPSDDLIAKSKQLKKQNFNLYLFQGDVAEIEDVNIVLRRIGRSGHPLRGIYHLAGVIEDGALATLKQQSVEKVFRPKIAGAWNLHQATQQLNLHWFVAFSSLSGMIGIAGQGVYAAANAFVEALMRYRSTMGLPGSAIAWGPWHGGMTARLKSAQLDRFKKMGLSLSSIKEIMAIITNRSLYDQAFVIAGNFTRATLMRLIDPCSAVNDTEATTSSSDGTDPDADARLVVSRLSLEEQRQVMTELVLGELARTIANGELTADTPLREIEMDSLAAVAIVQRLRILTGKPLPISLFFDSTNVSEVVRKLQHYF